MCFERLKYALYETYVLSLQEFGGPFVLDVDASEQVVGAVPSQLSGDKLHTVAYFSKEYCQTQSNYLSHHKKLL